MNMVYLTQSGGLLGGIAKILGIIMDGIFNVLDFIGIPNVGLSIILFTMVVYLLMMPLTIKQQKFSKLSAKMNPELQVIRDKYKDKKDNDSMMQMNAETQAVYAKYGVSPSGSCVQLLIQMPILFSLYRVINNMPAYVTKIGDVFRVLAEKIITVDNGEFLKNSGSETIKSAISMYGKSMEEGNLSNGIIDVLNKLSTSDMNIISEHYGLADLTFDGEIILSSATQTGLIDKFNDFLGLNMSNSPSYMVSEAWAAGAYLMVVAAFAIPALSAITQWLNAKLMPQQQPTDAKKGSTEDSMASSLKMMNTMMPLMSAFFCYTLPAGMGLYWIAGSVVRSIQQVVINKHIDKIDLNELIEKNKEKSAKKMAKVQEQQKKYAEYAAMSTKNISTREIYTQKAKEAAQRAEGAAAPSTSSSSAKPGSLMARANMVKDFNERNSSK